ncbi:MAG: CBS domain-containing protein [Pyrinomonadaceae bacterium]
MNVKDVMTADPVCCTADMGLQEVARLMLDNDCGCIPVVDGKKTKRPLGTITDRDITIRTVADGKNPIELTVSDAMSPNAITVTPLMSLDECCDLMEKHRVRRLPVIDEAGKCCGIIAQADIAVNAGQRKTAEVVQEVSKTAVA